MLSGATALVKLGTPSAEELGLAKHLALTEIGGTKCIVLQQASRARRAGLHAEGPARVLPESRILTAAACGVSPQDSSLGSISTVVVRGSTDQMLDDVERAVDDGVNAYKALCRDARSVPAGGATEVELARQLQQFGRKVGVAVLRSCHASLGYGQCLLRWAVGVRHVPHGGIRVPLLGVGLWAGAGAGAISAVPRAGDGAGPVCDCQVC